ncbi:Protein disulfide-isomerase tmx3 [Clonorchis sinensis]|uniref:Protein disulfide-isomerase tmx3 n=1 Tax=Clonorchis sinensis TaxID=79923 RepID=A0A8T1N1A2_CLOSI|nr:Protein disulfide-isomerase tmx3 [Clonorchis sinensis]
MTFANLRQLWLKNDISPNEYNSTVWANLYPPVFPHSFGEFWNNGTPWLVNFYAPWCGHCRRLSPVYTEVSHTLSEIAPSTRVAKLDASSHRDIAKKFQINGFPTLKFFDAERTFEHDAERTSRSIVSFALRAHGPAVKRITDSAAFERNVTFFDSDPFYLLIGQPVQQQRHKDSALKVAFYEAAERFRLLTWFLTAVPDVLPERFMALCEVSGPIDERLVVVKDGVCLAYSEPPASDKSTVTEHVSDWILRERYPSFEELHLSSLWEFGEAEIAASKSRIYRLVALFLLPQSYQTDPNARRFVFTHARWLKWLEREFTDRKVCGSSPTSASRLPLSRLGQPGNIPTLVLPSGGMAARHRKGVTAERHSLVKCLIDLQKHVDRYSSIIRRKITYRKFRGSNPTLALCSGNLAVYRPPCFLQVVRQLYTERVSQLNGPYNCVPAFVTDTLFRRLVNYKIHRSAAIPFRFPPALPPERSTRAGILPGCPSLVRGSREAEVGFEPRTFWFFELGQSLARQRLKHLSRYRFAWTEAYTTLGDLAMVDLSAPSMVVVDPVTQVVYLNPNQSLLGGLFTLEPEVVVSFLLAVSEGRVQGFGGNSFLVRLQRIGVMIGGALMDLLTNHPLISLLMPFLWLY